jgi:hypothetical protein
VIHDAGNPRQHTTLRSGAKSSSSLPFSSTLSALPSRGGARLRMSLSRSLLASIKPEMGLSRLGSSGAERDALAGSWPGARRRLPPPLVRGMDMLGGASAGADATDWLSARARAAPDSCIRLCDGPGPKRVLAVLSVSLDSGPMGAIGLSSPGMSGWTSIGCDSLRTLSAGMETVDLPPRSGFAIGSVRQAMDAELSTLEVNDAVVEKPSCSSTAWASRRSFFRRRRLYI